MCMVQDLLAGPACWGTAQKGSLRLAGNTAGNFLSAFM